MGVMTCGIGDRYQHSGSIFYFIVTVFCAVMLQRSLLPLSEGFHPDNEDSRISYVGN